MSNTYYEEQMAKWEPVEVDEDEDDTGNNVVNKETSDV